MLKFVCLVAFSAVASAQWWPQQTQGPNVQQPSFPQWPNQPQPINPPRPPMIDFPQAPNWPWQEPQEPVAPPQWPNWQQPQQPIAPPQIPTWPNQPQVPTWPNQPQPPAWNGNPTASPQLPPNWGQQPIAPPRPPIVDQRPPNRPIFPEWQQPQVPQWPSPPVTIEDIGRPGTRDSRCPSSNGRTPVIFAHERVCGSFYKCNNGLRCEHDSQFSLTGLLKFKFGFRYF